jgi:hypothetical protein
MCRCLAASPFRSCRCSLTFPLLEAPAFFYDASAPPRSSHHAPATGSGTCDRACRHRLHLPDASGGAAGRPRFLPDLRHGAGAGGGDRRCRPQSRTKDMTRRSGSARADGAARALGDGRAPAGCRAGADAHAHCRLAAARLRHAGGAVGRLAVLRARLASLVDAQPQHVHADRARHRRGLALQRRGDGGARPVPAAFRGHGAVAVYFEAAAVITVLVLLGQVLELRARERPGAIKALLAWRQRPRGAQRPDGRTRRWRSSSCMPGDRLRVRPGEKVPVDGASSRAARRSTNRWSPASRCR